MFSPRHSLRRAAPLAALALAASLIGPIGPVPAGAATTTFAAVADARVEQSHPKNNYGRSSRLEADAGPVVESFLRFNVTGLAGPVSRARLRLYVEGGSGDGPAIHGAGSAWDERKITWNNKPSRSAPVADMGALSSGTWTEVDVTPLVAGNGTVSFNLVATSSDSADFSSREASSSFRPQLVVDSGAAPTTTSSSTTTTTMAPTTTTMAPTTTTTAPPTTTTTTAPGTTGTTVFNPAADARVESDNPSTNFGTATTLGADLLPPVETYLRFDLSGVPGRPTGATLRLLVTNASSNGPRLWAAPGGWNEGTITWANKPGTVGAVLGDQAAVSIGEWVEYDVSALVAGDGVYPFAVLADANDSANFSSREATASSRPQLVVRWTTNPDATPPQTRLVTKTFDGDSAVFAFTADEPVDHYTCSLDTGPAQPCGSPKAYDGLADGPHTFRVAATDLAGNTDPTPAVRDFNVGLGALRAGPLAPAAGAYLGVHHQISNSIPPADQVAGLEAFEADLGRKVNIDHWYEPWGELWPTGREDLDHEDGRIPMVSWSKPQTGNVLDITDGAWDSYINARADGIKALGYPIFLRWFWEMDGNRNADIAVSPGAYIAAWRYLHSMLENRGVTNVVWVWCPNAAAFETDLAESFYPGDDYVDWVCADGYNYYPDAGVAYASFTDKFADFHTWAVAQGKPAMAGEWGAQQMEPGRRAAWVDEARQAMTNDFPGIMAAVYFHRITSTHDWTLPPEPDAWAAYQALALDPWFNP